MIKPKFVSAITAVLACAAVIVQPAAAEPPTKETFTLSSTLTLDAGQMCEFPINVAATSTRTFTTHFNPDGSMRSRHVRGEEQDTFSANGKTLVGELYQFNVHREWENGVQVDAKWVGLSEMVKLPDGGVFIVAGQLDLLANGPVTFIVTADSGNSGNNLDAFCEALS
jgi:hypothetical protein